MRVLVTGGLGLVGRSVVAELLAAGHEVRLLDSRTRGFARRLLHSVGGTLRSAVRRAIGDRTLLEVRRGDLCNIADVGDAVRDVDGVIHLGALIPPAADRNPRYARYVNVGGTRNLIRALEELPQTSRPRLVFTSSIAIYGDRRHTPDIRSSDLPHPGPHDHYAPQKQAAEDAGRTSPLEWVILRLTYIVSTEKLQMDPLMFDMPLDTEIEVCSATDAARALVAALTTPEAAGRTFDIAGGAACRTTFRDYLETMLRLFGLGEPLPDAAFSRGPFHCGFVDTSESERVLGYQHDTLSGYYDQVARAVHAKRFALRRIPFLSRIVRSRIIARSPHAARQSGRAEPVVPRVKRHGPPARRHPSTQSP